MPGIALRSAEPSDLPPCADLWTRALTARDGVAPPEGTRDRVRGALVREDAWTVLAEQDGALIGLVAVLPLPDGALLLQYLAVDPEAGGRGVGTRLLAAAIEHAGDRRLALDVRVGNARAVALYERAGFVRTGEPRPHPLGGEPMVRFERRPA